MTDFTGDEEELARTFDGVTAPPSVANYTAAEAGTGSRYGVGSPRSSRIALAGVVLVALITASLGAFFGLSGHRLAPAAAYATPPARESAVMVYDPKMKVTILFGGRTAGSALGDTWQWDGTGWTELHPAHSPQARANAEMGYDPSSGRLVLYGGETLTKPSGVPNQICPMNGPGTIPPQINGSAGPAMAMPGNTVVITPGVIRVDPAVPTLPSGEPVLPPNNPAPSGVPVPCYPTPTVVSNSLTDTWTFDGSDWAKASDGSRAQPRYAALVTDTAAAHLYALGYAAPVMYSGGGGGGGSGSITGVTGSGSASSSGAVTGSLSNSAPVPAASAAPCPSLRAGTGGGANGAGASAIPPFYCPVPVPLPLPVSARISLSTWNDSSWVAVASSASAPGSIGSTFTDPKTGRIVDLVGSPEICPYAMGAPQMGAAESSTMIACNPCNIGSMGVPGGKAPAIACFPPCGVMNSGGPALGAPQSNVMCPKPCGGASSGPPVPCPATSSQNCPQPTCGSLPGTRPVTCCQSAAWEFDGQKWASTPVANAPSGLTLTAEADRGDVIALDSSGNTWQSKNLSTWAQLHPATSPGAIGGAAMTYDATHQRAVLFGGVLLSVGSKVPPTKAGSDATWTWDGSNWTRVSSVPTPTPSATPTPTPTAPPSASPTFCMLPAAAHRDVTITTPAPTTTPAASPSGIPSPPATPSPLPPEPTPCLITGCGNVPASGVCPTTAPSPGLPETAASLPGGGAPGVAGGAPPTTP